MEVYFIQMSLSVCTFALGYIPNQLNQSRIFHLFLLFAVTKQIKRYLDDVIETSLKCVPRARLLVIMLKGSLKICDSCLSTAPFPEDTQYAEAQFAIHWYKQSRAVLRSHHLYITTTSYSQEQV